MASLKPRYIYICHIYDVITVAPQRSPDQSKQMSATENREIEAHHHQALLLNNIQQHVQYRYHVLILKNVHKSQNGHLI